MADPWATFGDVQDDYEGTLGVDKQAWIIGLIARAQRLLNARVPSVARRLADGSIDSSAVRDAIVNAVLRVVRNPEGFGSETEGNYLYSLNRDVAAGKLYFTGDDLALVRPLTTGLAGRPIKLSLPCERIRP